MRGSVNFSKIDKNIRKKGLNVEFKALLKPIPYFDGMFC